MSDIADGSKGLRVAMAHGWSQQQAAEAWNAKWPEEEDGKTSKNIAYWEAWQSSAGYPPSLPDAVISS